MAFCDPLPEMESVNVALIEGFVRPLGGASFPDYYYSPDQYLFGYAECGPPACAAAGTPQLLPAFGPFAFKVTPVSNTALPEPATWVIMFGRISGIGPAMTASRRQRLS